MYGWMGKLLEVDLTNKKSKVRTLNDETALSFLGGRGIGVYLIFCMVDPQVNPLSSENILIFAAGPLTGTITPSSSRCAAVSKSPLTGTIFDSNAGGQLGPEIKASGYDAIIISGSSSKPAVIIIDCGEVKVKGADAYWGMKTSETIKAIKQDFGNEFEVACIGPAGENQVYFACIRAGDGNFFGRGGLGAVMGSKNLKAIAIRGNSKVEVANAELLSKLSGKAIDRIKINPITGKVLPKLGTPFLTKIIDNIEALPTRNFCEKSWTEAGIYSGEVIEEYVTDREACPMCPIACKAKIEVDGVKMHRPEYESLWALGVNCQVKELKQVFSASKLCDELGLDTISTGSTIACLIELSQRGVINEKISWGDGEAITNLIEKIAKREDLGKIMALGAERLAKAFKANELAMTVKKLELPAYDPRELYGMALAYATSNRGGCHLRSYIVAMEVLGVPILIDRKTPIGKAELVAVNQNFLAAVDSLIICKFATLELDDEIISHIITATIGKPFDRGKLLKIGERIWNLERLFNLRAGLKFSDDTLPARLLMGGKVPLREMLKRYYEFRGWDPNGVPLENKLKELELLDVVKREAS
ncbi:MAG: aldehyde ferredoxin oxidoreductase family protein [archaeon GB-1867-005]|nr:aldehyde ferredoxin oxidoreductase family protein [Candidatus Culexmicrobium cathedralense]